MKNHSNLQGNPAEYDTQRYGKRRREVGSEDGGKEESQMNEMLLMSLAGQFWW